MFEAVPEYQRTQPPGLLRQLFHHMQFQYNKNGVKIKFVRHAYCIEVASNL